jgi:hypothetical protein
MWEPTLGSDNALFAECCIEKLKIGFLKHLLRRVKVVCEDDVELVVLVGLELKFIADVYLDGSVVKDEAHSWEVLLGGMYDSL